MTNSPYIKSPRQQRAVEALLESSEIPVKDIGPIIGALNARQVIKDLRDQGFYGIIRTKRYTVIDQDGHQCRPGAYFIPPDWRWIVKEALLNYSRHRPGQMGSASKERSSLTIAEEAANGNP